MSASRALALGAVLGLHALLGWLLGWTPSSAPDRRRELALHLRLLAAPRAPVLPKSAGPRPELAAPAAPAAPGTPAAPIQASIAQEAAPTDAVAAAPGPAPRAAALNLSLPLSGPQARRDAAALNPALHDPRANSPRLGAAERLAMAVGQIPCYVDELDAEGRMQRYAGRLQSQSSAGAQTADGVALGLAIQGGHQGGPDMASVRGRALACVRAR